MENELEFLRYFYYEVDNALGPASGDIYFSIKEDYMLDTGHELPDEYKEEDEDDC